MPVVGYLGIGSLEPNAPSMAGLRKGLNEQGFVEAPNVIIETRLAAEGHYDQLLALAFDLVRRPVAVLVATGSAGSAQAAKAATTGHPDRVCERQRPGQGRSRCKYEPAGRQRYLISTSSQVAPNVSPVRVAVRMRNSRARAAMPSCFRNAAKKVPGRPGRPCRRARGGWHGMKDHATRLRIARNVPTR